METLNAVLRVQTGKGQSNQLRRTGRIPAVLYGEAKPTESISVDARQLERALQKGAAGKLIQLSVEDGKKSAVEPIILKDFQRHPVKGNIIHVDLLRVSMDHEINVKVPVRLEKEDQRPRDGAFIELLLHELEINCLPGNIPEHIMADVSKLTLGSPIYIKDVTLPDGVRIMNAPNELLVEAIVPAASAEPEAKPAEAEADTAAAPATDAK
jgi:large subunit ribosomal protein L25